MKSYICEKMGGMDDETAIAIRIYIVSLQCKC